MRHLRGSLLPTAMRDLLLVQRTQDNNLYGVSCGNATFCMNVGYGYSGEITQNLSEKW